MRHLSVLRDSKGRSAELKVLPQRTAGVGSPMLKPKGKQKFSASTGTVVLKDR